jgi:hypothetical protein
MSVGRLLLPCTHCRHLGFRQRDTKENDMPVDLWTKMALTLIAVSLAVIAWKLPFADVGHAQPGTCGANSAPCYIANNSNDALKVQIINAQDFH